MGGINIAMDNARYHNTVSPDMPQKWRKKARLVDAFAREPALDLARDRRARGRDQTFDGGAVG